MLKVLESSIFLVIMILWFNLSTHLSWSSSFDKGPILPKDEEFITFKNDAIA